MENEAIVKDAPQRIDLGDHVLVIDRAKRMAWVDSGRVWLTDQEFRILAFLARQPGATRTKLEIFAYLYSPGDHAKYKIINVFVCKLRRKLANAGLAHCIETEWGRGYRLGKARSLKLPCPLRS